MNQRERSNERLIGLENVAYHPEVDLLIDTLATILEVGHFHLQTAEIRAGTVPVGGDYDLGVGALSYHKNRVRFCGVLSC